MDVGQDGAGILAGEAAGAARGVPHAAVFIGFGDEEHDPEGGGGEAGTEAGSKK